MYVVRPEVDVKRFVGGLGFLDERDGFLHEAFGDIGTLHPAHPFSEPFGISPNLTWFGRVLSGFEGERQELGTHTLEIGQGFVEAVFRNGGCVRNIALAAHVPFTEVPGGVPGLLERSGKHGCFGIEPLSHSPLLIMIPVA